MVCYHDLMNNIPQIIHWNVLRISDFVELLEITIKQVHWQYRIVYTSVFVTPKIH